MKKNYELNYKKLDDVEKIHGYLKSNIPVYLHGKSGCGKSDRVRAIDPDCEIIYLRNATPELINGKSVYVPPLTKRMEVQHGDSVELEDVIVEDGHMMDIMPAWLMRMYEKSRKEPDRIHILFFDELSNAMPAIQGYVFNIVLDHEVNGKWVLPDNVRIVAAGNDMEESLAANEIAQPLFSRFAHVYINTDFKSWFDWACRNRIHPLVIAYNYRNNGEFLRTDYTGTSPNCDPRKWEMVSKVLYETGDLCVIENLIDKKVADEFVKFAVTPIVPLSAIVENDLYEQAVQFAPDFSDGDESLMYVASLSQVDDEHIEEVYPIVLKLKPKYRALFNRIWIGNNEQRARKVQSLDTSKGKVIVK